MAYRLKLSDGTTTRDLLSSTFSTRESGLMLGLPEVRQQFIANPFYDGERLVSNRYGKRQITIDLDLSGVSAAYVSLYIHQIQLLLMLAEERHRTGYGATVYLESQWADTAGQSIFYDVLWGSLDLGADFYSAALRKSYHILRARLTLICKPFARYANQTLGSITLENYDYSTNHNYQDCNVITVVSEASAGLYWKLTPTGAAGSKTVWLAKRTGSRRTDDLWTEGEDLDSSQDIADGAHTVTFASEVDAACSTGNSYYCKIIAGGAIGPAVVGYMQYDLASPPRGTFRVLARVKRYSNGGVNLDAQQVGFGWDYGNLSKEPDPTLNEYYDTDTSYEVLDLGLLKIPPTMESDIATNSTFSLRIYCYLKAAIAATNERRWYVDYIFLLPIDEGCVIISNVGASDVIALDSISEPPCIFLLDGSDNIVEIPSYVGSPFFLHQDDTRLYILRDDAITVTWASVVTYQPRFFLEKGF